MFKNLWDTLMFQTHSGNSIYQTEGFYVKSLLFFLLYAKKGAVKNDSLIFSQPLAVLRIYHEAQFSTGRLRCAAQNTLLYITGRHSYLMENLKPTEPYPKELW